MRQGSWMRCLVVLAVGISFTACDPYAYYPARSKPMTPPPGEAVQPAAAPADTPAPAPDLAQQVKDLQARVQQLETRLAETEAPQSVAPATTRRAPERTRAKATGAPAGYPPPEAGGDKLYVEGYRLYQGKKYAPARDKFAQYLKNQPQGPKAPEARYYLAYTFAHEGKPKDAAVEFNKLVTQFPKSSLAPAALKQQALAYKGENKTKLYQETLKKLVKTYPKSPEAREAEKLLKEGGR